LTKLGRGFIRRFEYVYVGNIPGHAGESTFCPKCKKMIIQRTGYMVGEVNLKNGKCRYCGKLSQESGLRMKSQMENRLPSRARSVVEKKIPDNGAARRAALTALFVSLPSPSRPHVAGRPKRNQKLKKRADLPQRFCPANNKSYMRVSPTRVRMGFLYNLMISD